MSIGNAILGLVLCIISDCVLKKFGRLEASKSENKFIGYLVWALKEPSSSVLSFPSHPSHRLFLLAPCRPLRALLSPLGFRNQRGTREKKMPIGVIKRTASHPHGILGVGPIRYGKESPTQSPRQHLRVCWSWRCSAGLGKDKICGSVLQSSRTCGYMQRITKHVVLCYKRSYR